MTTDLPPLTDMPIEDVLAPVRHVIGSPYVESVKDYILALTGLRRAVGPGEPATKDIRTDRVFISVDDDGRIARLTVK